MQKGYCLGGLATLAGAPVAGCSWAPWGTFRMPGADVVGCEVKAGPVSSEDSEQNRILRMNLSLVSNIRPTCAYLYPLTLCQLYGQIFDRDVPTYV